MKRRSTFAILFMILLEACRGQPGHFNVYNESIKVNDNFGYSVDFHDSSTVCDAVSDSNRHGYYGFFEGNIGSCNAGATSSQVARAIGVWADYNTYDLENVRQYADLSCGLIENGPDYLMDQINRHQKLENIEIAYCQTLNNNNIEIAVYIARHGNSFESSSKSYGQQPTMFFRFWIRTTIDQSRSDAVKLVELIDSTRLIDH